MTQTPLPGSRWFRWVHNFTLRVGVMTGLYLTAVMVATILVANRLPFLEHVAEIRNWTARGAFLFFLLIPMACFLRAPVRMFASGMCAWAMLSVNYALMGLFFTNLHVRLGKTPFQVLILGTLVYGVAAAASWVAGMALLLRQQPIAASRRRM
jgi:hypothetical protein